jgi:hypothetical protein
MGHRPQHSWRTWVSGHLLARRQERDVFVDAIFEEIGLPLLQVTAKRDYSLSALREMHSTAGGANSRRRKRLGGNDGWTLGTIVRLALIGAAGAIVALALVSGDGHGLMRSTLQGFGWGVGREIAHSVVHHVLR